MVRALEPDPAAACIQWRENTLRLLKKVQNKQVRSHSTARIDIARRETCTWPTKRALHRKLHDAFGVAAGDDAPCAASAS